jgi:hypothetical protein
MTLFWSDWNCSDYAAIKYLLAADLFRIAGRGVRQAAAVDAGT